MNYNWLILSDDYQKYITFSIICFVLCIICIIIAVLSYKQQKKNNQLKATSDLNFDTTNMSYHFKVFRKEDGSFSLKVLADEKVSLSEVTLEHYIGSLVFSIYNENKELITSEMYNPFVEYGEDEPRIGDSAYKYVKKELKMSLLIDNLPQRIVNPQGEVHLIIEIKGFVMKSGLTRDEVVSNLHLRKKL